MRKRTKITIDPKYILIIIVAACVVLMVVSFKFQDKMEPVRSVAGYAEWHKQGRDKDSRTA